MKKILVLAVLFSFLAAFQSCTTQANSMGAIKPMPFNTFEPLKRADYEIIGDVNGKGDAVWVLIFTSPKTKSGVYHNQKQGFTLATEGIAITQAEEMAVFNAINSIPGADMLLFPRYEYEIKNYFFGGYVSVKVHGKAIKVKNDR